MVRTREMQSEAILLEKVVEPHGCSLNGSAGEAKRTLACHRQRRQEAGHFPASTAAPS